VSYRATCPQCVSVFRLGTDQLDAAQGWVQCGVCGAAFDARTSLLLEDGSPLPQVVEPEPVETTPPGADDMPAAAAPTAAEASPDETIAEAAPDGEDLPAAGLPGCGGLAQCAGIAQREAPLDLPSIILIDPDIPVDDDLGPIPQIYPAPASSTPSAAPAYSSAPPAARVEYATPLPDAPRRLSAARRTKPWVWVVASLLLLALLLAQTGYFLRDTLVSRLPQTRPAVEQACAALGCTLSLPKNLALLQVVGSDLQTEARGRLKLVLTLGNRADQAQAWPVLSLTLTDQRNRPLARRSFAPSEYLDDPQRIAAGIPPRSEQPLSLPLAVRELTPMGFDLKLTY